MKMELLSSKIPSVEWNSRKDSWGSNFLILAKLLKFIPKSYISICEFYYILSVVNTIGATMALLQKFVAITRCHLWIVVDDITFHPNAKPWSVRPDPILCDHTMVMSTWRIVAGYETTQQCLCGLLYIGLLPMKLCMYVCTSPWTMHTSWPLVLVSHWLHEYSPNSQHAWHVLPQFCWRW